MRDLKFLKPIFHGQSVMCGNGAHGLNPVGICRLPPIFKSVQYIHGESFSEVRLILSDSLSQQHLQIKNSNVTEILHTITQ